MKSILSTLCVISWLFAWAIFSEWRTARETMATQRAMIAGLEARVQNLKTGGFDSTLSPGSSFAMAVDVLAGIRDTMLLNGTLNLSLDEDEYQTSPRDDDDWLSLYAQATDAEPGSGQ